MRVRQALWVCVCAVMFTGCALDSGDGNGAGSGGSSGASGSGGTGGGDVCSLPFDPGPCDAAFQRWAFVPELGACFPHQWGGCGGNANNFQTQQECESACGLGAMVGSCPPNRVARDICVQCGLGGGCAASIFTCALVCGSGDECPGGPSTPIGCVNDVCDAIGCI